MPRLGWAGGGADWLRPDKVTMDIGGVPVIFADTAGIRDTTDVVETEGIKRALAWCVCVCVLLSSRSVATRFPK